jgi:eukaryotic-like serine/threonine-protein kinase
MGAVYLARRDDARFERVVAIKILQHALVSPNAVARFRDERHMLAALDHPGIVRLLDGGETEDGLPYLVMEHVEGKPLAEHAAALDVRGRVMLVVKLAAALQYAHQKLIIHRDVKPENVLVDGGGIPKLLDFGIAKLASADAIREAETRTGMALFTVEYASPEQARNESVSVATDVYSLGALLYELLAGRPPQQSGASALETLRAICETEPPRPSAVAPIERRRQIAGDLDNITLRALQKRPEDRYPSIAALGDDLQRFLDGFPVKARAALAGSRAPST